MIERKDIFKYVKKKYGIEEDYPFPTAPTFPVMRHPDNRKWFAIIMDVPREKLGLIGTERVDVINVKLGDTFLADMLIQQEGYFRGYHISRGNWISIILDGTVSLKDICDMIDESFIVTASKQNKKMYRPVKEWIVPVNPKYYDIEHAFDEADVIDWKQGNGIKTGDTVFMYVAAPVSAIIYKCKVIETDIPFHYDDGNVQMTAQMKIRIQKKYKNNRFTFESLKEEYGIYAIRGPRGVPYSLSEALKR